MAIISKKKIPFPISPRLRTYLKDHEREKRIGITYNDLTGTKTVLPFMTNTVKIHFGKRCYFQLQKVNRSMKG